MAVGEMREGSDRSLSSMSVVKWSMRELMASFDADLSHSFISGPFLLVDLVVSLI